MVSDFKLTTKKAADGCLPHNLWNDNGSLPVYFTRQSPCGGSYDETATTTSRCGTTHRIVDDCRHGIPFFGSGQI